MKKRNRVTSNPITGITLLLTLICSCGGESKHSSLQATSKNQDSILSISELNQADDTNNSFELDDEKYAEKDDILEPPVEEDFVEECTAGPKFSELSTSISLIKLKSQDQLADTDFELKSRENLANQSTQLFNFAISIFQEYEKVKPHFSIRFNLFERAHACITATVIDDYSGHLTHIELIGHQYQNGIETAINLNEHFGVVTSLRNTPLAITPLEEWNRSDKTLDTVSQIQYGNTDETFNYALVPLNVDAFNTGSYWFELNLTLSNDSSLNLVTDSLEIEPNNQEQTSPNYTFYTTNPVSQKGDEKESAYCLVGSLYSISNNAQLRLHKACDDSACMTNNHSGLYEEFLMYIDEQHKVEALTNTYTLDKTSPHSVNFFSCSTPRLKELFSKAVLN